ncbi:hypothetical protein LR010_02120 [Candidatus Gracilibacteria bacterium]|nr:hypothetical protein [Candidatus Gracilibacteria bacterium]
MLDNSIDQQEWTDWKDSEGQLLQFDYFLGNQRMVGTTEKPFLITEGTQLEVGDVIRGDRVEIILDGVCYIVTHLLSNIPERRLSYKSGEDALEYIQEGHVVKNFIRSWFREK